MLTIKCQIAAEIEAIEGAAETLLAADVFLAFNPSFTPEIEIHARNPVRSVLSPYPSVPGARSAKMSFDVELVGTAAAGDAVHFSDILQACGVDETLVAYAAGPPEVFPTAIYTPASTAIPSVSLAMYLDGKIYKLWGARGTCRLILEDGKPGIFSFEFTGADFTDLDGALLAGTTLSTIIPPIFTDASLTIDAYAAVLSKIEIDLANTVALRKDANSPSGHKSAVITGKAASMTLDPENVLVATEDFMGNWRSGAQMAFSAAIGVTAGNIITITAPKVQYQGVGMGDRDGQSTLDITALLAADAGDDEWSIAIT
ncbi:MAG: hypothetical protein PF495_04325 [Spirochaetales bacterium]|jgi:hypothetical protein|nr:hypothetical protein [Spirochaetales bacterium]